MYYFVCIFDRFGFVEFDSVEAAESAKADKDGLEIQGRVVQLAFANDKPGGNAGAGTPMAKRGKHRIDWTLKSLGF